MKQSDDNTPLPMASVSSGKGWELRDDVYYYTDQIVNIVFIGKPGQEKWVLIDAGMPKSGSRILEVAEARFGKGSKPDAIILTHGHFDHVGGLVELINRWRVPVYAHPLEFPYLTGKLAYPEEATSAEDGMPTKISAVYPHQPIDISGAVLPLATSHSVNDLPEWQWIHTPGHSPGHVSLFRERDRLLLAGDALTTIKQDPFYRELAQKEEVNGPPRLLTTDWKAAKESVRTLRDLLPEVVIPGHGSAMEGEPLKEGLNKLADNFEELTRPEKGRYR